MPVFKLAAGDEHHRELGVRLLVGSDELGRYQLCAAVRRRELVDEHDFVARIALVLARVGDRVLGLQTFPGDAGDRVHRLAHLVEHVLRAAVVPVQTQAAGHFLDDPQILARIARRVDRRAAQLHLTVGVGEGAVLLGEGGRRQHHVGEIGGFGQEDVLHHQPVQLGQRVAGVVDVRVGHRRVLAHDVAAVQLAVVDGVHDLDHGQTRVRVQRGAPQFFELLADGPVADRLVVREHHRDQAGVGGTLHVVLAAQRMQAGAAATDLAGHHDQRNQATRVVGAMHVLRHAHAPQNHRGLRGGEHARDLAQRGGRNAADLRHLLGREVGHVLLQLFEAGGAVIDEGFVDQTFLDDGVHHRVQHGHVGVRLELQEVGGVALQVVAARVAHDEPGTVLDRVLHPGGAHRVVHQRVGADQEDHFRMQHVAHRVGHGAGTDRFEQRSDRRSVAQAGAVVDVIGTEAGTHQLLEQIGLFVRALGRAETGQRVRALAVADLAQLAGGQRQRLFPARFAEGGQRVGRVDHEVLVLGRVRATDQRLGQTLRVAGVVEAEAALHAQALLVGRAVTAGHHQDLVVLDVVGQLAADAAVRADRIHLLVGLHHADAAGRHQRAGRAGLHAFAAGHAGRGAHRVVLVEHDLRRRAAEGIADHVVALLFAAGAHAAVALDAGVKVHAHRRVRFVARRLFARLETRVGHAQLAGPVGQFRIRLVRLFRHVGQQQFDHHLLRLHRALGLGLHLHAGRRRTAAARGEHALAFDLDHAGAAVAVRTVAVLVAEVRDVHALAGGGLDDGFAHTGLHRLAVEREFDAFRGDRGINRCVHVLSRPFT